MKNKELIIGTVIVILAIAIAVSCTQGTQGPFGLKVGDQVIWQDRFFGKVTAIDGDKIQIVDQGNNWSWTYSTPDYQPNPVWFTADQLSGIRKRTDSERRAGEREEQKLRSIRGH